MNHESKPNNCVPLNKYTLSGVYSSSFKEGVVETFIFSEFTKTGKLLPCCLTLDELGILPAFCFLPLGDHSLIFGRPAGELTIKPLASPMRRDIKRLTGIIRPLSAGWTIQGISLSGRITRKSIAVAPSILKFDFPRYCSSIHEASTMSNSWLLETVHVGLRPHELYDR